MKISVVLPLVKETSGALRYGLADRKTTVISDIYVRKDGMEKINGEWPAQLTVTIEVGQ